MHKFLLRLKIKGCETVFKEELGPGVVAVQEVTFASNDPLWVAAGLLVQEDLFIKEVIEVQIEEVGKGDIDGKETV